MVSADTNDTVEKALVSAPYFNSR